MFNTSAAIIEEFNCDDTQNLGSKWNQWVNRLEQLFDATKVTDDKQKQATLFLLGGKRLYQIHNTLPAAVADPSIVEEYAKSKYRLEKYFNPKRNKMIERFTFSQAKQCTNETVEQFVTRLRLLTTYCDFTDADEEITRQVLLSCQSGKLRRELLKAGDIDLKKVLEVGRIHDTVEYQAELVETRAPTTYDEKIDVVDTITSSKSRYHDKSTNKTKGQKCFNCGNAYPHKGNCPAQGKKCNNCHKMNHFSKVCRGRANDSRKQTNTVNNIDLGVKNDERDYIFTMNQNSGFDIPTVQLQVHNVKLLFKIDTGATVNIIDEESYDQLNLHLPLNKTCTPTYTYNSNQPLQLIGKFSTSIYFKGKNEEIEFIVAAGRAGNILGYQTCMKLNLIRVMNTFDNPTDSKTVEYWKLKYPRVFSNKIGKMKDVQLKLHIDKDVKPVQARPRYIPFHLRNEIDKEIQRKLDENIIEEVIDQPTDWLSELVIVPKPNGKIRLCVDMKMPNTAIKSEKYEMPSLENILHASNGMKVFSKLDLNSAFEQLELHPDSRYISRFRTHRGIYQSTRLFYGVKSAPEKYHDKIRRLIDTVKGAINATDDILIMGATDEENYKTLDTVLKILDENGLTLNADKCIFGATEITFFGLKITQNGVSLSDLKYEALKSFQTPRNAAELHSFLGLTNYASRWIPNLANLSQNLWKLTRKDVRWEWNSEHQNAIDKIKNSIIGSVGHFDLKWDTSLTVDASPVGLSAILTQENPKDKNEKKIIACISRILSDTESRYSQIELEALACVWALERLQIYTLGRRFKLYTDNKAISLIFKNPLLNPPARIKRWQLRMSPFDFEIIHTPGRGNIADFLSRHPLKTRETQEDDTELYLNTIVNYMIPKNVSREDILNATLADTELIKLKEAIRNQVILDPALKQYSKVLKELTITDEGFILRDSRLVIPRVLYDKIINIAHEGHLGIIKTKQLLRTKVWFPNMDSLVENKILHCLACQATSDSGSYIAPIQMSCMPEAPWCQVSIDFFGLITPSNEYLMVLMDDYSRFPLVENIYSLTAKTIISKLDNIFGIFGIPLILRSDNGPPFNSEEFKVFAQYMGFKHRLVTPYWPRANGLAESFMKNLGKVLKTAKIDKIDWKLRLKEFLRNYRSTPHMTTKVPPAELFLKNAKTTRLPSYRSNYKPIEIDYRAKSNDETSKIKIKHENDKRLRTKQVIFEIGDLVLMRQNKRGKSDSKFSPEIFKIVEMKGNMITVEKEGKRITRNIYFFKKWCGNSANNNNNYKNVTKINKQNSKINITTSLKSLILRNNESNSEVESESEKKSESEEKSENEEKSETDSTADSKEEQQDSENNLSDEENSILYNDQILNASDLLKEANNSFSLLMNSSQIEDTASRVLRDRDPKINYRDARPYRKENKEKNLGR